MFGISKSVRSRAVQVCTPELFHRAIRDGKVQLICAQIADALERKRRGELGKEDYESMKTQLKSQLPILTPHATFKNGRRLNADAIPSGLSIYDKDHIPDPRGYWEEKRKLLAQKRMLPDGTILTDVQASFEGSLVSEQSSADGASPSEPKSVLDSICLVHVTPSTEGLRLVFVIPKGMDLATAQKWMSKQLDDADYDVCVKDLARPSFIVPESYVLYCNEAELFKNRSLSGEQGNPNPQSNPVSRSNPNPQNKQSVQTNQTNPQNSQDNEKKNRLSGDGGSNPVPACLGVQPSQSANRHPADGSHLGSDGGTCLPDGASSSQGNAQPSLNNGQAQPSANAQPFPIEYKGIPYPLLIAKLVELLGGEPQHGSRNSFIFTLSCYLRYICDDNVAWIKSLIPTFGEEQKRAFTTVESACARKQSHVMPSIVRKAIKLCQEEQEKKTGKNYDDSDFGDINTPGSYFYHVNELPDKLPRLVKLLVSKTPKMYQPAVSGAVFPPLAAHLCNTRFRYIDNVEHEATLMSILCAPTGSGKECVSEPINHIMADIRRRDAEQRAREKAWKDECNSKGSNKDKRERPEGLVIQEVNIDMTNPAFVLRMKEAEEHFLYAKVNELNLFDALKGKTNQHFRIMELAFDLGMYGQDRVGVQSVTETVRVRFNWNASCTPKKCRDYFRRVVTDGPVSRISFSTIDRRPCGSEIPVYGTYDAAFDEELRPYIDNLVRARGLVDCPQAFTLAKTLVEENAEFARLSQNYVFENLSFRANVIAYLKACVLYVANGMQWEKSIEDFVRWSERYDLWCKLKLFGQMIYDADCEQAKTDKEFVSGPKNLLLMLPDEFTLDDYLKLRRQQGFEGDSPKRALNAIYQWSHRGYVVKLPEKSDTDTYSSIFRKLKFLGSKRIDS